MKLNSRMYVPALKWRQGEYQALLHLDSNVKDRIVPLICVPAIEYDFETQQLKKTVDEHIQPFVKRFMDKWGSRPAWITVHKELTTAKMGNGAYALDHILNGLRANGGQALPALTLASDNNTVAIVRQAAAKDGRGLGLILSIENLMAIDSHSSLIAAINKLGAARHEIDLIVDLQAPNFEPYRQFANALMLRLDKLRGLADFRNLVLISSAFPSSLADIARGTDEIPRHDWLFYQEFLTAISKRLPHPLFGDYTVVHPHFTPSDPRMLKPAGKIVYTASDRWVTRKGGAFRGKPEQMHEHCEAIISDPRFEFRGAGFSFGDQYIFNCAHRRAKPSNLTRWKCVTINHHITVVADSLANPAAAP